MYSKSNHFRRGFSLIELIIVLGIGLVILLTFFNVYTVQSQIQFKHEQEQHLNLQMRWVLDFLKQSLRLAGYRPQENTVPITRFPAGTEALTLQLSPWLMQLRYQASQDLSINQSLLTCENRRPETRQMVVLNLRLDQSGLWCNQTLLSPAVSDIQITLGLADPLDNYSVKSIPLSPQTVWDINQLQFLELDIGFKSSKKVHVSNPYASVTRFLQQRKTMRVQLRNLS